MIKKKKITPILTYYIIYLLTRVTYSYDTFYFEILFVPFISNSSSVSYVPIV